MNIEELKKREAELVSELVSVREQIRNSEITKAQERYGVGIGSIVVEGGREYRVTSIRPRSYGTPWLTGNPMKTGHLESQKDIFGIGH